MVQDYDKSEIPAVYNLIDVPPHRDEKSMTQSIFRGLDRMVGLSTIEPDKPDTEPHTHPYEQLNLLIEGELDFIVGDEQISLQPYDIIAIPPGVEHTSRAVSDEPAKLLAFWPLREDRLSATEYQREFQTD